MIYLDNAATTFPKPEIVYKSLDKANRELAFNAGRGHYSGANNAFSIIEETRKYLMEKANASSLVFTPSATHSLNQIINGLSFESGDIIYCSPYDHNAIARTLHAIACKKNLVIRLIPLKTDLTIDLDKFEFECILNKPKSIFCTHVSNVTGYILPIKEIGIIAKKSSSSFIVDGAQAFGVVPVDLENCNIDYYVFAGHKTLYASFGIAGFLSNNNKLDLSFFGGTGTDSLNLEMPSNGNIRYEPSSPNIVAIAGLYVGAKWVFDFDIYNHELELVKYALNKLKDMDDIIVYDCPINEKSGIISFNIEGMNSNDVAEILSNDFNICVRGGYHCSPYIHRYLNSLGNAGTVRISFSAFNNTKEIDILIEALESIIMEV